jgi:hypothetical protein
VVMITVSPAAPLTQDVLDLSRGGGIEARERLIGALSYALRKAVAGLACAVRKAQQVQQIGCHGLCCGRGRLRRPFPRLEVIVRRSVVHVRR